MCGIKVFMVLWIIFLILTKSCDKIEEQDLEKLQEQEMIDTDSWNGNDDNEEDGWGSESDNEVEMMPLCVPNFFIPVSEPCTCIGSGKTIEENEVGILYCFPQPNKFKVKIEEDYKTISTPAEYENNMVPNQELKSCTPNNHLGVQDICFCGIENDKEKLKTIGSSGFVNLKHICVPLDENEKNNIFSPIEFDHHKLPYCYNNQCQRYSTSYDEEKALIKKTVKMQENWMQILGDAVISADFWDDREKVKLILKEKPNEKAIKGFMAENIRKTKALDSSSKTQDEKIIQWLLNVFGEDKIEQLIEHHKMTGLYDTEDRKTFNGTTFVLQYSYEEKLLRQFNDRVKACEYIPLNEQHELLQICKQEQKRIILDVTKGEKLKYTAFKKIINSILKTFLNQETKELLIEENKNNKKIIKVLLNGFDYEENKEKLMGYVMKETIFHKTAIHYALDNEDGQLLCLLLKAFNADKRGKFIEYAMKQDFNKNTPFHLAIKKGTRKMFELLVNVFSKQNAKLIECMLKKNDDNCTVLQTLKFEDKNEERTQFTFQIFWNAKLLCDLQRLLKLFKGQTPEQKNDSSSIWQLFDKDVLERKILEFLIMGFDPNMHCL